MPVGLDGCSRAALNRQRWLHAVASKHRDDRVPDPIIQIVRSAAVKVGDARWSGGADPHQLRVTLAQVSGRQTRHHHVTGKPGGLGNSAHQGTRDPFQPGAGPGPVPQPLSARGRLEERIEEPRARMQGEHRSSHPVRMFSAAFEDQL